MEPEFISGIITDTVMKLLDAAFVNFFCRTLNFGWWTLAIIAVGFPIAAAFR